MLGPLEKIINTLFPPKCIFCREPMRYDTEIQICSSCNEKLPFSNGMLLPVLESGITGKCDGAVSIFKYIGMAKESLIRFKFYNKPSYYNTYARLMARKLEKVTDIGEFDMVISVPLHKQKEFARGYNQAYLISKALGRELKLPECSKLLKRLRYTEAQSLLNKQNRQENIKGAFEVAVPAKINGMSILLVDDVFTTGSTLEECSIMLKQAGALKVIAVVVATGRKQ